MMEDLDSKARKQSLTDLISAMSADDTKRLPKKEPILTISISAGGGAAPEVEGLPGEPGEPDEDDLGGDDPDLPSDPFAELLRKKKAEQGGR